jgi:EpsI family protein
MGEMVLLARLGGQRRPLSELMALDPPLKLPPGTAVQQRSLSAPMAATAVLLLCAAAAALWMPERSQQAPARQTFASFPLELPGGWQGRPERMDAEIVAVLAVTDYHIANYSRGNEPWVNFYSAYYASQSGGESSHSPRTCIPGGGWAISEIRDTTVPLQSGPLVVNRTFIQKGEQRQLVYYWFRQRGRNITGEFDVKWYILRDAIVHDRSDGALIRLVTPLLPGEAEAQADKRLVDFMGVMHPRLGAFIPD